MKSTGVVRKVDELGRIVLPIEIRKVLDITKYSMIVTLEKSLRETLLKPAVRGATALNRDCTIFSAEEYLDNFFVVYYNYAVADCLKICT